jgi:hypothetical protein
MVEIASFERAEFRIAAVLAGVRNGGTFTGSIALPVTRAAGRSRSASRAESGVLGETGLALTVQCTGSVTDTSAISAHFPIIICQTRHRKSGTLHGTRGIQDTNALTFQERASRPVRITGQTDGLRRACSRDRLCRTLSILHGYGIAARRACPSQ